MNKRKVLEKMLVGAQIIAASAIVAGSVFLLYRYIRYGQSAKETLGMAEVEQTLPEDKKENWKENRSGNAGVIKEREDLPEIIRVRILGNDFKELCHSSLEFASESRLAVSKMSELPPKQEAGTEIQFAETGGGEGKKQLFQITAEEMKAGEVLCIEAENGLITVGNLERADGAPEYGGRLYLLREDAGIALINELPLETYLYGVVSSEMPSYYPKEALKAQAVCARTYAVNCIERQKNENFAEDLNDSVEFQVYNNYRSSEQSKDAVDETAGEVLGLQEVLYYSTSCLSEHREDLGSEEAFEEFLEQPPPDDAEFGSPWLRWEVSIPQGQILEAAAELYGFQGGKIDGITVEERLENGQASLLSIQSGGRIIEIEGEYQIRKVLTPEQSEVILMDGTAVTGMQMLPSAFFCCDFDAEERKNAELDEIQETPEIYLHGGGYGHGIGMSQCGAAALAEAGKSYRGILTYYYGESE